MILLLLSRLVLPSSASPFCRRKCSIACDQCSNFRRCLRRSSRGHAFSILPSTVHFLWRRKHVVEEGYRSGKSCHRAPVFSPRMMPSRQVRESTGGRTPSADFPALGNRCLISFHRDSLMKSFGAVMSPVVLGRRCGGHIDRVITT